MIYKDRCIAVKLGTGFDERHAMALITVTRTVEKMTKKISGPKSLMLIVTSDSYSFRCGSLPYPE
jgi:hypothetical protein